MLIALDKGLVSVLVLLDLSYARHSTTTECFNGIKGTALRWLKIYLSDYFQFVHVNDDSSVSAEVTHGGALASSIPIIYAFLQQPF